MAKKIKSVLPHVDSYQLTPEEAEDYARSSGFANDGNVKLHVAKSDVWDLYASLLEPKE
jgi:hypothetical protein